MQAKLSRGDASFLLILIQGNLMRLFVRDTVFQNHPADEDMHRSYTDITIAFRGTLSLTNVQFDLKFSRKLVPGRYWFGGALALLLAWRCAVVAPFVRCCCFCGALCTM